MSAQVEKEEQERLAARYAEIAAAQPAQEAAFARFVEETGAARYAADAAALGLRLDVATGHLSYAADFAAPALSFDLLYCRHGKTTGNTEPRVYQGFVDEPQNALNAIGLRQAEDAADLLDGMGLTPDLVICSPLSRAHKTGEAYFRRHPALAAKVELWDDAAEMRFGAWDNVMVKDLPDDSIGHLFYLAQNALVKPAAPYVDPASGAAHAAENFVETLGRMRRVLDRVEARVAAGGVGGGARRPLVLMYGHSMAGAALSILTGNGKPVDGAEPAFLGFDGKYIMPNATPVKLVDAA